MGNEMGSVVLTKALIEAGRTGSAGYTKKQLKIIGIEHPPRKGWLLNLIGTTITQEAYDKFVAFSTANRAEVFLSDPSLTVSKRAMALAEPTKEQQAHDESLLRGLASKEG